MAVRDRSRESKIIGCILYPDAPKGSFNSAEELLPMWNYYSPTCDIAYMLHDKDTDKDGNLKKAHYHVIIRSRSTMSLNTFQHRWTISGHCCMVLNNWDASVQYLVHQNPNYDQTEDGGYVYDRDNITANFQIGSYFKDNKASDPEYIQILKIINWASHNKANYYQIMKYAGENGYFSAYRKGYRMIYDILGSKPYLAESQLVDFDKDIPKEFIKE